jgi:glutamate---cysteine ligase / carboxylate-amine ligase
MSGRRRPLCSATGIDPIRPSQKRAGTRKLLDALVDHVADALEAYGDLDFVRDQLVRLQDRGTGAALQRRALERDGSLSAVVADAVAATVS